MPHWVRWEKRCHCCDVVGSQRTLESDSTSPKLIGCALSHQVCVCVRASAPLLLFRMQPVAAGCIIFWMHGSAADAVPLFPVSWYSFCLPRKDDPPYVISTEWWAQTRKGWFEPNESIITHSIAAYWAMKSSIAQSFGGCCSQIDWAVCCHFSLVLIHGVNKEIDNDASL